MSTPKVLDRIRKLLQLAGPKNPHEHEARSAAHQAVQLILAHEIVLSLPGRTLADELREVTRAKQSPFTYGPWPGTDAPPPPYDAPPPPPYEPPPPVGDPIFEWVNREFERRVAAAARKDAERARRQREEYERFRQRDPDTAADAFDDFTTEYDNTGTREWRQRRSRAWRAAGRPKKRVYHAESNTEREIPDYDGLSF